MFAKLELMTNSTAASVRKAGKEFFDDRSSDERGGADEAQPTFQKLFASASERATHLAQQAKKGVESAGQKAGILTKEEEAEQGLIGDFTAGSTVDGVAEEVRGLCPSMTYRQRIYGAVGCIGVGLCLDLMATLALLGGKAHIVEYAVLYTLGNVVSICGSGFVVGPYRQLKVMCKPVRAVACAIYLGTMGLTLVLAFTYANAALLMILLSVQYCALIWYGASFVPFGRKCIVKCFKVAGSSAAKAVDG